MAEEDDISTFFLPEGLADDLISPLCAARCLPLSWTSSPAPATAQSSGLVQPGQAETAPRAASGAESHTGHGADGLGSLSFPPSSVAVTSVGQGSGNNRIGSQAPPFGAAGPAMPGLNPLSELSATAPAFDPSRRAGPVMARPPLPSYSGPHATAVAASERRLPEPQQQQQSFLSSMGTHLGIGSSISWPEPSGSMPPQSAGGFILPTGFGGSHLPASAPISQFSSSALPAAQHPAQPDFVTSHVQPPRAAATAAPDGAVYYTASQPTAQPVASYPTSAALAAPSGEVLRAEAEQDRAASDGVGAVDVVDVAAVADVERDGTDESAGEGVEDEREASPEPVRGSPEKQGVDSLPAVARHSPPQPPLPSMPEAVHEVDAPVRDREEIDRQELEAPAATEPRRQPAQEASPGRSGGEIDKEPVAAAVEHRAPLPSKEPQQPQPSRQQPQVQPQQRPPRGPSPPPRQDPAVAATGEGSTTAPSEADSDVEQQHQQQQQQQQQQQREHLPEGREAEGTQRMASPAPNPSQEKRKKKKKKKKGSGDEEEGRRRERGSSSPAPTCTSSSTGWDSAGSSRSPSPSPSPAGSGKRSGARGGRGRERKHVVFGDAVEVGPGARAKEGAETAAAPPPAAAKVRARAKGRAAAETTAETTAEAGKVERVSGEATDELEQQLCAVAEEVAEGRDGTGTSWTVAGARPVVATALSLMSWVLGVVALSLSAVAMGGVSVLALLWRVHRYAVSALSEEGNIAACFGFLYAFPHLVEYVSPWAPPWAPICLWYAFLVQVFCTSGPPAVVIPARVALPLLFMMEGVSHHSFLLDLNGAELLVIACALAGFKTQRWCNPLMLLSLSVQAILASFWGESLVLQWVLLVGALSSLTLVAQCSHQAALNADVAHEAFRRAHLDRLGKHFDALHAQGGGGPEQGTVAGLYGDASRQALSVGYIATQEPTAL